MSKDKNQNEEAHAFSFAVITEEVVRLKALQIVIHNEDSIDLQKIMSTVARHYIVQALDRARGNKSQAAKMLGLPSYQTLDNWMKKHEVVIFAGSDS
jgi:transcriptional regulator with PAS, ATPase and Fis domain